MAQAGTFCLPSPAFGPFDSMAPFNGGVINNALQQRVSTSPSTYDAQVAAVSAGPSNGTGSIGHTAHVHHFYGGDGYENFRVEYYLGAYEFVTAVGGVGSGATLVAQNTTTPSAAVDFNFAAQQTGGFYFGNFSGQLFSIADPGGAPSGSLQALAGTGGSTHPYALKVIGSNVGIALVPNGQGGVMAAIPDGTATGGNTRSGGYCVDLQTTRTTATQVASGSYACIPGGNSNTASGSTSMAFGYGCLADGAYAVTFGNSCYSRSRRGYFGISSGYSSNPGDTQSGIQTLRGTSTSGSAVRLTADGNAASATNLNFIGTSQAYGSLVLIIGTNLTTTGHTFIWVGYMVGWKGASAATTTVTGTQIATGGTDTATVAFSADTTYGAANLTVTPPNSNTWHYAATFLGPEVG